MASKCLSTAFSEHALLPFISCVTNLVKAFVAQLHPIAYKAYNHRCPRPGITYAAQVLVHVSGALVVMDCVAA